MRLPIILMLLTIVLLPADLHALAAQVQSGMDSARVAVAKFLDRDDTVHVAQATPTLVLGGKSTEIR